MPGGRGGVDLYLMFMMNIRPVRFVHSAAPAGEGISTVAIANKAVISQYGRNLFMGAPAKPFPGWFPLLPADSSGPRSLGGTTSLDVGIRIAIGITIG
jgi:hypothetical protein